MKKLLFILLLLPFAVFGQTTYQLNYDSIRVNKTAGTGGTSLYGKVYLKNVGLGLVSDSILTVLNGRIRKIPVAGIVPTLGTSAISLGGTANGLSYLSGNYRLHKVTATTGGVFTTGTDTIGGNKRFTNSGSDNTVNIDHTSGAGIGLTITKGGNGEGLIVNKTSGSGNAVTVIGTVDATTLVKSGGTSSQFLKADGSVDATAYGTGSVTSVGALTLGTTGTDLSSSVANGTTTPVITLNVPDASATARGVVTTGAQTFAGIKTYNNKVTIKDTLFIDDFDAVLDMDAAESTVIVKDRGGLSFDALIKYETLANPSWDLGMRSGTRNFSLYNRKTASNAISVDTTSNAVTLSSLTNGIVKATSGTLGIASTSDLNTAGVVLTTTNQNVGGVKTFTDSILSVRNGSNKFKVQGTGASQNAYVDIHRGDRIGNAYVRYFTKNDASFKWQSGVTGNTKFYIQNATTGSVQDALEIDTLNTVTIVGNFVSTKATGTNTFGSTISSTPQGTLYGTASGSITSAQLATSLTDETGTGSAVFSASPTFTGTLNGAAATFSSTATATAFIPSGASVPTNGMYLSAANTLNFATNSTNRLSISSTGAATFNGASVNINSDNTYVIPNRSSTVYDGASVYRTAGVNNWLTGLKAGSTAYVIRNLNTSTDNISVDYTTGAATFSSTIKTAAPSGGTAKPFKIGNVATVTPTLQNRTIEIEIDGTTYYLTAKTTND